MNETCPQSPIQMAGWRVRMKPMSVSSAWLKLSCPTRLRRVIGTMWNEPNGTPTYGIMPPYCEPLPSVPISGSTCARAPAFTGAPANATAAIAANASLFMGIIPAWRSPSRRAWAP